MLERTAEVIEESRQEKIRITALVQELNEQKETSLVLQNEYQQAMSQLNEVVYAVLSFLMMLNPNSFDHI